MSHVTRTIEQALGSPITDSWPAPWGSKNRTRIAELADGRQVVTQLYSEPDIARLRLHAADQLAGPLNEHGVPVPRLLAYDLAGPPAWAAFERLPGAPAYDACGEDLSDASFAAVARQMGALVRRMAELDPAAFDLPRLWVDSDALTRASNGWLADLEPYLSAADLSATHEIIATLPRLFADRPAVVCHGDFGPQNVLVVGERLTGLLDLEDARMGDPLLDIAWWAWLVRAHTPVAFSRTWRGFLDAAGVDRGEAAFDERLIAIIVLRLLETADAFRRSAPEKHASWAQRLSSTLEWRARALD